MIDVISPMSFEQDKGYAGKILLTNTKYQLHNTDNYTDWKYDVTGINSTDGLGYFTPKGQGSTIEAFSWNDSSDYVKNGELTYPYTLVDTEKLMTEVVPYAGGGNDDTKDWTVEDWLKTTY